MEFDGSTPPDVGADDVDRCLLQFAAAQRYQDLGDWQNARACIAGAYGSAKELEEGPRRDRLEIRAWRASGELQRVRGRYAAAERSLLRALHLAESRFGGHDPAVGLCLNGLGVVYRYTGRHAEAESAYRRALVLFHELGRPAEEATVLHNISGLQSSRGRLAEAEQAARRALAVRSEWFPDARAAIASDQLCLAAVLTQAAAPDALWYAEKALEFYLEEFGPRHIEVGYCLQLLGHVHSGRGDDEKAEYCFREALAVTEESLGPSHPELLTPLLSLVGLTRGPQRRGLLRRAAALAAPLPASHPLRQWCRDLSAQPEAGP